MLWRTSAYTVVVIGLYFLLPTIDGPDRTWWVLAGAFVLGVTALAVLISRQVARHLVAGPRGHSVENLLVTLVSGVVFFALTDYAVARALPGQFAGLGTKTDALYFAVTTLSTVGFGDVHPAGQLARVVVTVQVLFNVLVIASAAGVLARTARGGS